MDLRLYSKSGQRYAVDITGHDVGLLNSFVLDSMYFEEPISIKNGNKISAFHGKHIEFFEVTIDETDDSEDYDNVNRIGFCTEEEQVEGDESEYE